VTRMARPCDVERDDAAEAGAGDDERENAEDGEQRRT